MGQLLLTPEIRGSNHVIGKIESTNFTFQWKRQKWRKTDREWLIFKNVWLDDSSLNQICVSRVFFPSPLFFCAWSGLALMMRITLQWHWPDSWAWPLINITPMLIKASQIFLLISFLMSYLLELEIRYDDFAFVGTLFQGLPGVGREWPKTKGFRVVSPYTTRLLCSPSQICVSAIQLKSCRCWCHGFESKRFGGIK